jgi:Tol biopolymer transport system component
MIEHDIRNFLQRMATEEPVPIRDVERLTRRGRRRAARTVVVGAVGAAVAIGLLFGGVAAIRTAPIPADRPTPSPAHGVKRANGEVLGFTGANATTSGDLVAVTPGSGEERVLVEGVDDVRSARWSADGRWVAFQTRGGLWVVSASREPRLVATHASTWMWSSTGAELAAIGAGTPSIPSYSGGRLGTIDPVTGETTAVGRIPDDIGDTFEPVWSPDGTRFVFGARGGAIYSLDVRSGTSSLLVQLPGEHLDSVDQIAWSPDGAHIAIMNDLAPGDGRLYMVDADGSNVRVVLHQYVETGIAWSPNGTRLAYQSGSGVIWTAPVDGSPAIEIGPPLAVSRDGILLNHGDLTWSPDGSQIAYRDVGFGADGGVVTVSAIDADGQNEATAIDDLTYRSWDGGWYRCDC